MEIIQMRADGMQWACQKYLDEEVALKAELAHLKGSLQKAEEQNVISTKILENKLIEMQKNYKIQIKALNLRYYRLEQFSQLQTQV
jgi:hypothetical protein